MKRFGVLFLGLCLLAVAGCSDDSTSPSDLPLVFTATLSPSNEVPPIAGAESSGQGAVQITFNVTREFNDQKRVTKYAAKVDGDVLKGTATSERDSTRSRRCLNAAMRFNCWS